MHALIYSIAAVTVPYSPGATIPPDVDPIPTISAAPSPTLTALAIMLFLTMLIVAVLFFFVMENVKATKSLAHELSVTNKALSRAMDPQIENSPAQALNNMMVILKNSAFFQSSTQSTIMRKFVSDNARLTANSRDPRFLPLLRGEVPSAALQSQLSAPLLAPISADLDPDALHEIEQNEAILELQRQQEALRHELARTRARTAHPSSGRRVPSSPPRLDDPATPDPAARTNTRASQHPGLKRKLSVPPTPVVNSDDSIGDYSEETYVNPRDVPSSLDHPQGSDGAMMRDRQEEHLTTTREDMDTLQAGVDNGGPGDTDTYPNKHGETYAEENARMRDQADANARRIREEAEKDAE